MAVTDWDNVTAITRAKILPGIEDQIVKDMPLFSRLFKKAIRKDGGTRIEKVVRYANSTQGGWYSGLDTLDTAQEQSRTRAYWNWRQCHQPIVVSNIDVAKNGGSEKVLDMMAEDMNDAKKTIQDRFGTALYAKQTGDAIDSLVDGCDDGNNTPTYGDIPRGVNAWWKGDYTTGAGTLSLATMASTYDDVSSGTDTPTLMVTHKSEWTAYEALLQPQVRFQFASAGYPTIDGGFKSMLFRGTPLIADEYCTDGYMYYLNEKYWDVVTLSHPMYPTDKMGFTVTKMREPTDQDGEVGYILWYGNVICTQPRRNGVIRGLS